MSVLKLAGPVSGGPSSLYQIISGLSLTTNLKLCLDAGDAASYDSGVQTDKWLDTSGGGYDFYRGTGTGSDAADPTFNGSAGGLSSAEYWSSDGGDRFTYDTTVETWMAGLSQNNAVWSMISVVYFNSFASTQTFISTKSGAASTAGLTVIAQTTGKVAYNVSAGAGGVTEFSSTAAMSTGAWYVVALSINEGGGANASIFQLNGSEETFNGDYTNPSSGSEDVMRILSGNGVNPFLSGGRMACLAVWDTNLSSASLTNLYNNIKGRFGL